MLISKRSFFIYIVNNIIFQNNIIIYEIIGVIL